MKYIEFKDRFKPFPVFSVLDIVKYDPSFDSRRLVEWQLKGYIIKVKRGFYCFSDRDFTREFDFVAANKIYTPSYVSLESALAYYGLIPEGVFSTISVTTKNTVRQESPLGQFEYLHVKPAYFFGYKLVSEGGLVFKIAEIEKVMLDFFYLRKLNSKEEIEAMRFNMTQFHGLVDHDKMNTYLAHMNSRVLDRRMKIFNSVEHA